MAAGTMHGQPAALEDTIGDASRLARPRSEGSTCLDECKRVRHDAGMNDVTDEVNRLTSCAVIGGKPLGAWDARNGPTAKRVHKDTYWHARIALVYGVEELLIDSYYLQESAVGETLDRG